MADLHTRYLGLVEKARATLPIPMIASSTGSPRRPTRRKLVQHRTDPSALMPGRVEVPGHPTKDVHSARYCPWSRYAPAAAALPGSAQVPRHGPLVPAGG